jgi:hypothetical protein
MDTPYGLLIETSSRLDKHNVSSSHTVIIVPSSQTVEEVFPSLVVVGWYTVGTEPTSDDVQLQKHVSFSSLYSLKR